MAKSCGLALAAVIAVAWAATGFGSYRRCGYDLAGLGGAPCPECGAARTAEA